MFFYFNGPPSAYTLPLLNAALIARLSGLTAAAATRFTVVSNTAVSLGGLAGTLVTVDIGPATVPVEPTADAAANLVTSAGVTSIAYVTGKAGGGTIVCS
jgi:hypothetical protein